MKAAFGTLWRKNGLFGSKERLIQIERTAFSDRKNGFFGSKERLAYNGINGNKRNNGNYRPAELDKRDFLQKAGAGRMNGGL